MSLIRSNNTLSINLAHQLTEIEQKNVEDNLQKLGQFLQKLNPKKKYPHYYSNQTYQLRINKIQQAYIASEFVFKKSCEERLDVTKRRESLANCLALHTAIIQIAQHTISQWLPKYHSNKTETMKLAMNFYFLRSSLHQVQIFPKDQTDIDAITATFTKLKPNLEQLYHLSLTCTDTQLAKEIKEFYENFAALQQQFLFFANYHWAKTLYKLFTNVTDINSHTLKNAKSALIAAENCSLGFAEHERNEKLKSVASLINDLTQALLQIQFTIDDLKDIKDLFSQAERILLQFRDDNNNNNTISVFSYELEQIQSLRKDIVNHIINMYKSGVKTPHEDFEFAIELLTQIENFREDTQPFRQNNDLMKLYQDIRNLQKSAAKIEQNSCSTIQINQTMNNSKRTLSDLDDKMPNNNNTISRKKIKAETTNALPNKEKAFLLRCLTGLFYNDSSSESDSGTPRTHTDTIGENDVTDNEMSQMKTDTINRK